jgi:hypothetical protein
VRTLGHCLILGVSISWLLLASAPRCGVDYLIGGMERGGLDSVVTSRVLQDLQERSKQAFLDSVKERSKLLTLRSFLFAYSNISLDKLAKACGVTPVDVRRQLDALVTSGLARSSGVTADASVDGQCPALQRFGLELAPALKH